MYPQKYSENSNFFDTYSDNYNEVLVNKVFYREIDSVQFNAELSWSKPDSSQVRIDKKVEDFDLSKIYEVLGLAINITTKNGCIEGFILYRNLVRGMAIYNGGYGFGYTTTNVGIDTNNNTIYVIINYTTDTPFSSNEFGELKRVDYEKIIFTM